ncbi:MAG: DUF2794 domain-containing protein [Sphingosinicella sp.]
MGTVLPFARTSREGPVQPAQIGFSRFELNRIADLYGRMVAAGLWKDYALEFRPDAASFWAFRRAAESPEYRIEKRPGSPARAWALVGEAGQILRRGHSLGFILAPVERRLLKVVS